jgi:mono/diheme cytochrome c family protein
MTYLYRLSVCVVGTFLTLPVTSYADGCRVIRSGYVTPTYHNNAYVAPVVAYNAVYPVAIPIQTLYQVAPDLAQTRVNQVIAEDAAKRGAKEALNEFKKELQDEAGKLQQNQRLPDKPQAESTDPLGDVPISTSGNKYTASSGGVVGNIFNSHCTKCHGQGDKLNLSYPASIGKVGRLKILASVRHDEDTKAMPLKMPKLALAEIRSIQQWAYEESSN